MKRLWFAVAFIFICALLCVSEQIYIKNICSELTLRIEEAQLLEKEKDDEALDNKIEEIESLWNKKNDILFVVSDHSTLDDLALNIRSLKSAHNMKSALEETRTLVIIYYEDNKISFANVF